MAQHQHPRLITLIFTDMSDPFKSKPVDLDTFALRANKRIVPLVMDWFSTVHFQIIGDLESDSAAYMATLVAIGNGKHLLSPASVLERIWSKIDNEIHRTIEDTNRPFSELDSMISANEAHLKALSQQTYNIFRCMIFGEPSVFSRQSDNLTSRLTDNKSKSVIAVLSVESRKSSQEIPRIDRWLTFSAEIGWVLANFCRGYL